jgi:hypothetical protein
MRGALIVFMDSSSPKSSEKKSTLTAVAGALFGLQSAEKIRATIGLPHIPTDGI